jgi:hypothetical protein
MNRIWAVTSFFNPADYRTKLLNYRIFRQRLGIPLLAVEHSHLGLFELKPGDADLLVQLSGGDVMWQKERLLNVAISRLPEECEVVAWLDCDIVFQRTDWAQAAMEAARQFRVCQLYRRVYHLRKATPSSQIGTEWAFRWNDSFGWAVSQGLKPTSLSMTENKRSFKRGHAWCARRELLQAHGLYDRNILGGGVRNLAFALTGQVEEVVDYGAMSPAHARDYRTWAEAFQKAANGPSYIDGEIFHLWHGDFERRRYARRHDILSRHNFDPARDIALDESGCWRWNSAKPDMHQEIRDYFAQRLEDS